MKGRAIRYSEEEMLWLSANRALPIAEYHAAFCSTFVRDDVAATNLHSLRKRKGWKTGRSGCFEKGAVPFNKGLRCPEGTGGRHTNARKTQFRKGNRTGKAEQKYQPIGTERISKDGYRERKIHDGMPMQSRWQLVQRVEWEALNGPIPPSHCLKCRDGDKLNTKPSNWELIPRGVLPHLNGGRFKTTLAYDAAEPEVKPVIMAVAKLKHAVKEARSKAGAA